MRGDVSRALSDWLGRNWVTLLVGSVISLLLALSIVALATILQHEDLVDRRRASGGVYRQESCQTTYVNQCATTSTETLVRTSCLVVPIESCDDACAGSWVELP